MDKLIDDLIKLAFAEDIGDGDHTTLCCIPETAMGKSQLIIKEDGVLAGVEMAKRIFHDFDPELKMNHYGKGKYLLRHAFQEDSYLPQEILWREKAAFSDAVGHSMVDYLKEYAESVYTDQEMETLSEKYTYARPFTKESLLYREIFEKYYPGQAEMIAGFWMPNKEWEGCDVNDPSARVLSNYGESGK